MSNVTQISFGQLSQPSQTWRKSACTKQGKDYPNSDLSTPTLKFLIPWLHKRSFFLSSSKPHVPFIPFSLSPNIDENLIPNPCSTFSHSSAFLLPNLVLSEEYTKLLEKAAVSDSGHTAVESHSPPTLQTSATARHDLVLLKILGIHLFAYPFFN